MTAPYLRPRTILDNFSRLDPDAWNPVDVFRARRKELRESARMALPTSTCPKGALALDLGGETGPA